MEWKLVLGAFTVGSLTLGASQWVAPAGPVAPGGAESATAGVTELGAVQLADATGAQAMDESGRAPAAAARPLVAAPPPYEYVLEGVVVDVKG